MRTVTAAEARTGTYEIDPGHSRIGFTVRSLGIKTHGSFTEMDGTGYFDATNPSRSKIAFHLDAASIDTHNARRDAHLRSKAFLAADAYPDITFLSTAVEPVGDDCYRLTGDLTMKGRTKPVIVEVQRVGECVDESGTSRIDFRGHAVIRRTDWGVRWNAILEMDGLVISNKVHVEFSVSALQRDAALPDRKTTGATGSH
jgi:polyisoprenoid-binding protein YceI